MESQDTRSTPMVLGDVEFLARFVTDLLDGVKPTELTQQKVVAMRAAARRFITCASAAASVPQLKRRVARR